MSFHLHRTDAPISPRQRISSAIESESPTPWDPRPSRPRPDIGNVPLSAQTTRHASTRGVGRPLHECHGRSQERPRPPTRPTPHPLSARPKALQSTPRSQKIPLARTIRHISAPPHHPPKKNTSSATTVSLSGHHTKRVGFDRRRERGKIPGCRWRRKGNEDRDGRGVAGPLSECAGSLRAVGDVVVRREAASGAVRCGAVRWARAE